MTDSTSTAAGPPVVTIVASDVEIRLAAGEAATFGRQVATDDRPDEAVHLGLTDNPRLHAHAGTVAADQAGWVLTNNGRWLHLRVTEHGGPNRLDLDPGRVVRVPYASCRVEIATGDEVLGFDVDCPVLEGLDDIAGATLPVTASTTVGGLGLDREAGYFRALVALCEPRLRDPQATDVATVAQVVRTLNRTGVESEPVTAKAVERRLAHVRRKLAVGGLDPHGVSAAGLEARDASRQLADLVLRTGTVGTRDLDLVAPADERGTR